MSRPEVDRNQQVLTAVRAAAQPLSALGRAIPPLEDSSVQATAVCLAHLRWVVAAAGRALVVRQADLSTRERFDLAEAILDAEYSEPLDLDVDALPAGIPPQASNLRPATAAEEGVVQELADLVVQVLETDQAPAGGVA